MNENQRVETSAQTFERPGQAPAIFRRAFVLRLLLYGTIFSAVHLFVVWLLFRTGPTHAAESIMKFVLFPWVYLRDPLVTHVVYSFVSPWNFNSYQYVTWFDLSGIVANSALWGFSIAFFLSPEICSRGKKDH